MGAAGLVLTLVAGDMARGTWPENVRLQNELDTLQKVNAAIRAQNAGLERSLKSLKSNPALLEQAAREDLGFIRDGEVVVVLPR